jgi:hypothetical protein
MINLFANDGQRIYEVASFGPFIVGDPFVAAIGIEKQPTNLFPVT